MTVDLHHRCGFVALIGAPNAGKSSLINMLAKRDAAIVTPIPGTTRDVLEVPLSIGGVPVTLLDTAGLRDSDDPIEVEGIRRARVRAAEADLVLQVVDARERSIGEAAPGERIVVVNKIDLAPSPFASGGRKQTELPPPTGGRVGERGTASPPRLTIRISAKTGEGLPDLHAALADWANGQSSRAEAALITQARHRRALQDCAARLADASASLDPVLRAESLRAAAHALGTITGRVGVEDMLDTLFGRFCIGK